MPPLRAYVLATGRRIAPFQDPVSEVRLGTSSLSELQGRVLAAVGAQVERVERLPETLVTPCLVLLDDVYVSYVMLEQFVALAHERGSSARLALEKLGGQASRIALMGVEELDDGLSRELELYDLWYLCEAAPVAGAGGAELSERARPHCRPLIVPRQELTERLRMPRVPGSDQDALEVPVTARVVGHVRHWIHVLRLNQMLIGVSLWDYIRENRRAVRRRFVRAFFATLFRDRSLERRRILARLFGSLNVIEEGARIHPTAEVRGSFIGRNARIGAGAKVRSSMIGEGAVVTEDACINHSVIGERCLILRDTYMLGCVAYPEATISNYKVQLSVFGRRAFLTASAALVDAKFHGHVRVEHEGELVDTGTPFLGVCLGHDVVLGAHVTVQSGRSIPNGYEIVTPPEQVLSRIPDGLPARTPLVVEHGALRALRSASGLSPE